MMVDFEEWRIPLFQEPIAKCKVNHLLIYEIIFIA